MIRARGAVAAGRVRGVTGMGLIAQAGKPGFVGRGWHALSAALGGVALAIGWVQLALAEEPLPWQMGMQPAATPVRERMDSFHDALLIVITVITVFVLGLLLYVMWRFNAKRHPVASKTTHNTLLEVIWTTVPIFILLGIAIPSFKLLYYTSRTQHADMTLKVTGHQWYWSYEYPDQGGFAFDSNMIPEDEAVKAHKLRLLDVDNPVVLPVGATVRVLISGTDVIHSWYLPAAGVQEYAVVGRVNESWMQFDREGIFYGQCNQICGVNHPFMPIEVKAVAPDKFAAWSACAKAAADDKARAACYAPIEADKDAARVAANAAGPDAVK
jgi:cytochrome c oxidase subunit 2